MICLDLDDPLRVAGAVLPSVDLRDVGLLESALARPQASAFGSDAYPDVHSKAAALLHAVAGGHGLVDGNKRLALAATIAFLGINGWRLTLTNDEAYDLVIAVAPGELDDLEAIADSLRTGTQPRHWTPPRRPLDQRHARVTFPTLAGVTHVRALLSSPLQRATIGQIR